jgi:hypothetical protein
MMDVKFFSNVEQLNKWFRSNGEKKTELSPSAAQRPCRVGHDHEDWQWQSVDLS